MYFKYVSTDSGTYCSVYVSLQHVNCALAQVQVHSAIFTVFSVLHKSATTIRSVQPHDTKRGHYRKKKSESIFHPTLTDEQKRIFWTAVRLRPFVLLLRAA